MGTIRFGPFFKEKRIAARKTLRKFCLENSFDPGNISKLERGRLPVPKSREVLEKYAKALQIAEGTDDWHEFFDLASLEAGRIPPEVLSDSELMGRLPIFFRTARGQNVSEEELTSLIETLRRA